MKEIKIEATTVTYYPKCYCCKKDADIIITIDEKEKIAFCQSCGQKLQKILRVELDELGNLPF